MERSDETTAVGQLPTPEHERSLIPLASTLAVWLLGVGTCGALAARYVTGGVWVLPGVVRVDGLTLVLWLSVTFFSGIVHSYSRRYMAGTRGIDAFFSRALAFTLAVTVLVAADHVALFWASWLAMGLAMASLIGHVEDWPQARAAASLAGQYFVASTMALGVALATLWSTTGATTVSGVADAAASASSTTLLFAAGALLLAAMIQSALLPFHTWLLSSMTAPTPASALMHAGFVNAGGILLTRFAPVVTVDSGFMLAIVLVGAASALGGKLLKTVQTDVKRALGCSTVGQMGFMIAQAGLGFFAAAVTHLVLHGFYKAYQFLASGSQVTHEHPSTATSTATPGALGAAVALGTAVAGGVAFAVFTGKGTSLDSGLLLTALVALTVLHAAREVVTESALPATVRYGLVPAVALPAVAVYAAVYNVVAGLLRGLPAVGDPTALSPVHGLVALAFLAAYLAIESGAYKRSERLYVALVNATHPPTDTLLTAREDYDEY